METAWDYALPTNEQSKDYQYESPIFIRDHTVYFIAFSESRLELHMIDTESGSGKSERIPPGNQTIPSDFFFLDYKEKIIFYTGDFYVYDHAVISKMTALHIGQKVGSYFLNENLLLFFAKDSLFCYDLDSLLLKWKINISNKNYIAGEISLFEEMIACYGDHELLLVEIENGRIADRIKIPRIDKLFQPIRLDDEHILLGYTNWSNAGVLKYNQKVKQVVWKNKRKFQGPQLRCRIYQYEDRVFWVKNDTELICLDVKDGEEVYSVKTNPWLYTDLVLMDGNVLFGTAGRDGYINCIDAKSGELKWAVPLKMAVLFLLSII